MLLIKRKDKKKKKEYMKVKVKNRFRRWWKRSCLNGKAIA